MLLLYREALFTTGTDLGGSVRIPGAFTGITALKTTSRRLPLNGLENDGGQPGVLGVANSLGVFARSAVDLEIALSAMLETIPSIYDQLADPRLVPLAWRSNIANSGKSLKIVW